MKIKIIVLIATLIITSVSCVKMPVQDAHNKYIATWNNQLNGYRNEFRVKDAEIKYFTMSFLPINKKLQLTDKKAGWNQLVSAVFKVSVDVRDAFIIAGRGESTKALIAHMNTNPPAGLSDTWFQHQIEGLKRESMKVDHDYKVYFQQLDNKMKNGIQWILEIEYLARRQGMVMGKYQELISLHSQASSYYQDYARAMQQEKYIKQQQMRGLQTMMAAGMFINQMNYQRQLLHTLNRPRTCTWYGNRMTCR